MKINLKLVLIQLAALVIAAGCIMLLSFKFGYENCCFKFSKGMANEDGACFGADGYDTGFIYLLYALLADFTVAFILAVIFRSMLIFFLNLVLLMAIHNFVFAFMPTIVNNWG